MPGFDRSGPQGMGPMTGGRRGYCNGNITQEQQFYGGFRGGLMNRRGYGNMGRPASMRGGFGRRGRFQYPMDYGIQTTPAFNNEDELNFLRNESVALKEELRNIENRITDLENEDQADR